MAHISSNTYVAISLNTVERTFETAQVLLEVGAVAPPERQRAIAASASLALTACLEQSVFNALSSYRANLLVSSGGAAERGREIDRIDGCTSLRSRVRELPQIISEGRVCLDRSEPDVRSILALIDLRNSLMHVEERALSVRFRLSEGAAGEITLTPISEEEEEGRGSLPQVTAKVGNDGRVNFIIDLKVTNPWNSVSLIEAELYRRVVRRYIDEIVNCPTESLEPGRSGLLRIP